MRLFTGLALPPEAIDRLSRLRLRLSTPGDGLRWSSEGQWHITLQFYGDVSEAAEACLRRQLSALMSVSTELSIEELGIFAGKGIVFAKVPLSPALEALQRGVVHATAPCGVNPEKREYKPHITLARSKGRTGHRTVEALFRTGAPAFGGAVRWLATEVVLYESVLRPDGAEYIVRERFPLQPAVASEV